MKSGSYAMKSKLKLYKDWGITFDCPFEIKRKPPRPVAYATKNILTTNITQASNKPFLAEQLAQKNAK